MICAWKELLEILPPWMRGEIDKLGQDHLQELRLRINSPPELIFPAGFRCGCGIISRDDLNYCINIASQYSPWVAVTSAKGYLTAPGGHRIGLCGEMAHDGTRSAGIREASSLCIRIARDVAHIADRIPASCGSILILGAPGWGKTTLLRDLSRRIAETETVCVADERCELFPMGFTRGKRMDVLTGCPKGEAIELLIRTMGPSYIAVDEITATEDCDALVQAANCGVFLLATAHAASMQDYLSRQVYRRLIENRVFSTLCILKQDKTYTLERIA